MSALRVRVWSVAVASALLLSASSGADEPEAAGAAVRVDATSFRCITNMTMVRGFYVDNVQGRVDATLAVANAPAGGVYPAGSIVQLVPGEAMVKREEGFDATTHDWEFFELDVSKDGTRIRKRGAAEVVNRFGGNCFGCHSAARSQWDLICETDHGCAPVPFTREMIGALQRTDPRCGSTTVSEQDADALRQLDVLRKPKD